MGTRKGFNAYRIEGDVAYIALTNRKNEVVAETMVDAADLAMLQAGDARLSIRPPNNLESGVVYVQVRLGASTKQTLLHRVVMAPPAGTLIDHINGDGMDNRRSNLRVCTYAENNRNRRKRKVRASAYKGVSRSPESAKKPWRASIKRPEGKQTHLGCFWTEEEAARAYDDAARELFGEFACPNFPQAGD